MTSANTASIGKSPAELHSAWSLLIPSDAAVVDAAEAAFARANRSAKGTLLSSARSMEYCLCPLLSPEMQLLPTKAAFKLLTPPFSSVQQVESEQATTLSV